MKFGTFIRRSREVKRRTDRSYSLRQVALRVGVEPAYLSKVERNEVAPPSEEKVRRLARELDEDADRLLALAGKVSTDLQTIIRARPVIFGALLRELEQASDEDLAGLALRGRVHTGNTERRGGRRND